MRPNSYFANYSTKTMRNKTYDSNKLMPNPITLEQIQSQLCTEIQTIMSLKPGSVTTQTHLPSLGMDSLRFVSLLLVIEQKFGVNLMKAGLKPRPVT